jgi:rubrerythrin
MSSSSSPSTMAGEKKDETTGLANSTYNILIALGKEAQFLYSTIDTYTNDAEKANRSDLVNMWKTIKQDRQNHLAMLREALEREAKQQKLT